jgi:hypothetical protein
LSIKGYLEKNAANNYGLIKDSRAPDHNTVNETRLGAQEGDTEDNPSCHSGMSEEEKQELQVQRTIVITASL